MPHSPDYGKLYEFRYHAAKLRRRDRLAEARLVDRCMLYRGVHGMLKLRKQPKRRGHHGWRTIH